MVDSKKQQTGDRGYVSPRDEYVLSPLDISLRALARAWDIPFRTLAERSRREKWVEQREKYQKELKEKTDAKVMEATAESDADATTRHIQYIRVLQDDIIDKLKIDTRQFTTKDAAVSALVSLMKLERMERGMKSGDRPEGEEGTDIGALELLQAYEQQKRKEIVEGKDLSAEEIEARRREIETELAKLNMLEAGASASSNTREVADDGGDDEDDEIFGD